jgi:hypothetical protein
MRLKPNARVWCYETALKNDVLSSERGRVANQNTDFYD